MLTLLYHFCHPTRSIYWLLTICMGTVSDNQYQIFFFNALIGKYWIVMKIFHSCKITICQAKNYKKRKNNIEKYIVPLPWLIIMNVPNLFGEFVIIRNTDELIRDIVNWRTFCICNYFYIPMKYPAILVSFPLNIPMFILWNSWDIDLNMEWGLWYLPEPKILYTILWEGIFWFKMAIFETSLKK